ncbi:DUF397 domain-containing protein [Streptomyces spinoverrucosus]|uniref:DUF397 domain-containing protein n=1 Tax=Streptomyces spinoverrucosus TaxID=284043 RepID=UPI0018C4003F|nr:DUF397 domain-containing protein [Streptomyces spinoverrucosus]MBG0854223.1 DUF397 domain-containing protein [Streptomyces spinoverrucosus]
MNPRWQKSSYCSEGASCVYVTATLDASQTIHLTESGDPTGAILTATPATFGTLLTTLKEEPHATDPDPGPRIDITFGEDEDDAPVILRETSTPDAVVTTTRRNWDVFVLGVQAGEFDHFAEGSATATG